MSGHAYCTLFAANFLAVGLELRKSIIKFDPGSQIFVLCMDKSAEDELRKLNFEDVIIIGLSDLGSEVISEAEGRMTFAQLCWLCQPLICRHVLSRPETNEVIYMDADCYFLNSPRPLFEEIERKKCDVSLVPHFFPSRWKHLESSAGTYCVQFNYFKKCQNSFSVLDFWTRACMQYDKEFPGRYNGQMSLTDWPSKFNGVCVIENRMAGVAPWNAENYPTAQGCDGEIIFFHFHGLSRLSNGYFDLGENFKIPKWMVEKIYFPYLNNVNLTLTTLDKEQSGAEFFRRRYGVSNWKDISDTFSIRPWKSYFKYLLRRFKGEIVAPPPMG